MVDPANQTSHLSAPVLEELERGSGPFSSLIQQLTQIVGKKALLYDADELLVYECDGYIVDKSAPDIVVFPTSTEQVSSIVKLCNQFNVPFLARGAGTSLSGGCLPIGGGVMIVLTRMKQILEINLRDRYAVVEPGMVNLHLTNALKGTGYHYAPDPSSQGSCTIGGNIATNSGGPHTLKYGVTTNHVLGLEAVLPDGSIINLGGPTAETPGYDLHGVYVGNEGTFGICTKAIVRLTRDPEAHRTMLAVFHSISDATRAISEIIAAGIIPSALEMMDQGIIQAIEEAFHFGFPLDAGAVLLIEVDGLDIALDEEVRQIVDICNSHNVREIQRADTPEERQLIWKSRKQAFGAIGRLSPSYCTQDGVVPRTRLPEILEFIEATSEKYGMRIVNVFHAGDGNVHPILLFDERDQDQIQQVLEASEEILSKCLELGGSVTGEHGIGVEKINFMSRIFNETDLSQMEKVRNIFNPRQICSRDKVLPPHQTESQTSVTQSHPGRRAPH
ncbi:FAD-binding oxidoreductase [Gimesia panareensis]|uniref:FAD-binding oxidoreductase n=1 Tax=Gimesia panareensis TaxID=2527978 RepID=UPI00118D5C64|nr:FAD-linked oxidase C-terminal domain-containing protein [Gimesia panareensis]QDU49920.1 putative FAD-linked oxidoreductase [Gimesia panareensis]